MAGRLLPAHQRVQVTQDLGRLQQHLRKSRRTWDAIEAWRMTPLVAEATAQAGPQM